MNAALKESQHPAVDAARVLLDAWRDGKLTVSPACRVFQRNQIAREVRFTAEMLETIGEDSELIAETFVADVAHGLDSGALLAARGSTAARVAAGVHTETRVGLSVWFDSPQDPLFWLPPSPTTLE